MRAEGSRHKLRRRRALRTSSAIAAAAIAATCPLQVYAAGRVWFANSSNWNQATNWFNLSGGGQAVPAPGDDAYLTQDDDVDRVVTFDGNYLAPAQLFSLTIDATGTGRMSLAQSANRMRAATEYIGDQGLGIYQQTGGFNDVGTMYLGYDIGSGTYALSNTATLTVGSALYVGYGGGGTMNQSGGSLTVTNGAELVIAYFPNSSGTYNLSGGTLNTPGLRIGDDSMANGSFVHSGGTATISADLELATFSTSSAGAYTMTGGRLVVGRNIMLGEAGSAEFMQSGGTVLLTGGGTNGLLIGLAPVSGTNPASIGSYTLSGTGVLSVTGRVSVGFAGNGTFLQTGGQNLINGGLVLASATGTNTSAADYTLQGGTLQVTGTIQLNAGGTFTQSGGTLSFTTFNMDGGTINGTLTNGGTFNYTAGTFSGRLVNAVGSVVNFNSDFTAANGMSNATVITTGSNRTITLHGLGLANSGTILMLGSVLTGSGPLVNSGTLSGFGEIGGTGGFTNAATWDVAPGDYRVTNSGPVASSGVITVAASTAGVSLLLDGAAVRLDNTGTITLNAGAAVAGAGGLVNKPAGIINAAGAMISTFGFTNQGTLNVGIAGTGDLDVTPAFANSGSIVMTGTSGLLSGGTITNTGAIAGRGQIANNIVNNGGGTIAQTLPGLLTLSGSVSNSAGGLISVGGGGAQLTAPNLTNSGTISIAAGGTFSAGTFGNSGVINVAGTLDVDGVTTSGPITYTGGAASIDSFGPITIVPGGKVVLGAGNPNVVFYDNIANGATSGGISVAAGATANFLGNVSGGGPVTNSGTVNLASGKSYFIGELSGTGGATVVFDGATLTAARITQSSLTLNASGTSGATVALTAAGTPGTLTSKVNALGIAGGATPIGKADLANTNLAIDYSGASPIATLRAQIRAGFNPTGARWQGTAGVTSSVAASLSGYALGYAEASDALGLSGTSTTNWLGQTVDGTSLLVRYTKAGDATLDGSVDFNDLVKVAQHYNDVSGNRTWFEGDLNYDGNVDFNDLVLLAQTYNTALPAGPVPAAVSADWAMALASVPEPGSLGAIGLVGVAVWGRRRKRASS
jgi:hypothetical protein